MQGRSELIPKMPSLAIESPNVLTIIYCSISPINDAKLGGIMHGGKSPKFVPVEASKSPQNFTIRPQILCSSLPPQIIFLLILKVQKKSGQTLSLLNLHK